MCDGGRRRWLALSLRWKLTLWVGAVYLVIQGVLSLVLVLYQRQDVESSFDDRLGGVAVRAAHAVAAAGPPWDSTALHQIALRQARGAVLGEVMIGVYDREGRRLACSLAEQPAGDLRPHPDALPTPQFTSVATGGDSGLDGPVRIAYLATVGGDGAPYVVRVAATWAHAARTVRRVSTALLYSLPLGVIAATAAGYVLAGVAVQPLRQAARVAQSLEALAPAHDPPTGPQPPEVLELQRQLHDARRRITAAYHAQARFVSNVSHEMRTPIAVLLTEAQTMRRRADLPDEARAFVASVEDEMQRLGRMVDAFLALTRLRGGGGGRPGERTAINDLVLDAAQLSYHQARSAHVQLAIRLDEGVPDDLCVEGEPQLLRTMFDNLLRHALRNAPPGSPVEVAVHRRDATAQVCVRDHGPGLSDDLLRTLFDRFTGTGPHVARPRSLGLEVAQGIAELHGGHIDARNEDSGCRLTVTLPRAHPAEGRNE